MDRFTFQTLLWSVEFVILWSKKISNATPSHSFSLQRLLNKESTCSVPKKVGGEGGGGGHTSIYLTGMVADRDARVLKITFSFTISYSYCMIVSGTKYSRMDQVKFVERSLTKQLSNFLKQPKKVAEISKNQFQFQNSKFQKINSKIGQHRKRGFSHISNAYK